MATSPLEKAALAYELGVEFRGQNIDSSLYFLEMAIHLMEQEPGTLVPEKYHAQRISSLMFAGRMDEALAVSDAALASGLKRNDSAYVGPLYTQRVNLLRYHGNLTGALEAGLKGIGYLEGVEDRKYLGKTYTNMGVVSYQLGDQDQALAYYTKARSISESVGDTSNIMTSMSNMGAIYYLKGDSDLSLGLQEKSLSLAMLSLDSQKWVSPLLNVGSQYMNRGRWDETKEYFDLAEKITAQYPKPVMRMAALLFKARYFMNRGNEKMARDYMGQTLGVGEKNQDAGMTQMVYSTMVDVNKRFGDLGEALVWQKKLGGLKDSVLNEETMTQINEMKVRYESERKEQENEILKLRNEQAESRSQLVLGIFLLSIALLAAVIVFLVHVNRRKELFNRKMAQQQELLQVQNNSLASLNHEKDALMAIVAHDLKAPLIKAEGLGHLVETEEGISKQGRQALKMMQATFQSARSLVDEIVLVNQLESRSAEVELVPVRLTEVLEQVFETFQPLAGQKGIGLELKLPDEKLEVRSHEPYFKRIMDNLLSNAMKFSHSGTEVLVKAEAVGGRVLVSIQDQGPGISEAELPKLFQRFNRLSNRPTGGESSTGLGLSIVSQLAEAIQVDVRVESTLGKGTTFFLDFAQPPS